MSQAPGFDRLTRSVPGDGTKGVTMEAAATGEPERSWMMIDQPFRSFVCWPFSPDPRDDNQFLDEPASDRDDLLSPSTTYN